MIAFDIDGCANGVKEDIVRYGADFFSGFPAAFNESGYYLREIFSNAPETAYEEFWQKYGLTIYTAHPSDGVRETIDYLKEHDVEACYITSRDRQRTFGGMTFEDLTDRWLRNYGIMLPVYYCRNKADIVRSLDVSVMVEDKPETILRLQGITNVLIFRHKYNEHLSGTFVNNWHEIKEKLAQFCCEAGN